MFVEGFPPTKRRRGWTGGRGKSFKGNKKTVENLGLGTTHPVLRYGAVCYTVVLYCIEHAIDLLIAPRIE